MKTNAYLLGGYLKISTYSDAFETMAVDGFNVGLAALLRQMRLNKKTNYN